MKPRWIRILHLATSLLWLSIGIGGLLGGRAGFIPVAAAVSGVLGLVAAYLDRPQGRR